MEGKGEWFCGVSSFRSNFKLEWENGVWTKIPFLASGFCSHAAISLWFSLFFRFFDRDFFVNGFPNSFIVHSRSSCLFSQWKFIELYVRTCPAMFFFYFVEQKNVSLYLILPLFQHFAWNLFDISRLVSLFFHSAKSDCEHQLLSKAIQNESV